MSVDNNELFSLLKLASFDNDFKISSTSAFTESRNNVYGFVASENKKIHFCHYPKHRKEEKHKQSHTPTFQIQNIEWFSNESLRVKHFSFNPLGDYCLVVTENFDLYVICIEKILVSNEMEGKTNSGLTWNKEIVTGVFTAPTRSGFELGSPTVVLWWETCDFIQLGFVGTDEGHIVVINLLTGQMLSSTSVTGPVSGLQVMMDSAMDSVHLLVSSQSIQQQWRVLVEQRSTGYTWGCADCPPSPPRPTPASPDTEPRSRLQSIKQLSVDRIANLRHRLSEGRRMLRTRSETEEVGPHSRPESLTGQFGKTWFTVHSDLQHHKYILSGLTPDKSLLSLHNTEMEALNQSNFKLPPPHPDKVAINGKLIISSHQQTQRIAVSSSVLAEIKPNQNQSYKPESVLQNFQLDKDENLLQFSYVQLFLNPEQSSNSLDVNKAKNSPFRKLVCVTKDENGEVKKVVVNKNKEAGTSGPDNTKDPSSSPVSLFEQKTNSNIDALKKNSKYSDTSSGHILVTNKAIYLLRMTESPVDHFLGCAMQGKTRFCDLLSRSFCLTQPALLELAGDIRLYQGDVASAVSLYRQAGTKHVKTALKLAASGHVNELLTFLQAVFTSQNTEVSSGDRIHLSNLSLMAQFQQLCSSSVSRYYLEEKILYFLKTNRWYDLGLAVVQCLESGLLRLLAVVTRYLGVEGEVGAGLGRQDLLSLYSSLSADCRQELVSLTLLPHLVPSSLDCPGATVSLLAFLTEMLPSMTHCQLSSVLHNTCPARRDLQLLTRSQPVSQSLLELFLLAALHLQRRKQEAGQERVERGLLQLLRPASPDLASNGDSEATISRSRLACGHSHALLQCGELLSWGGGGEGRLGRGRLTVPTSGPGEVGLLRGVRVISVSCGKQHSVALTECGLYSWGCNKYGQLGLGLSPSHLVSATTPRHLELSEVCQVAAGQYHTVCVDSAGRVHSWGWNVHGQVGVGGIDDVSSPRVVAGLGRYRVLQVAAGYAHSVALTKCGIVLAWGCGLFGQLGGGGTVKQCRPVRVSLSGPVSSLTAGYFHTLALLQSGELAVWGANPQILRLEAQQRKKEKLLQKQLEEKRRQEETEVEAGEQGESSLDSLHPQDSSSSEVHLTPSYVSLSNLAGEKIQAITAGSQHSLILSDSGKLYSWGRNLEGQLGLGNRTSVKVPSLVTALAEETVVEVGAGADFSLAVTVAGTVFGWGSNTGGQLGRPPLEAGTEQQDNSRLVVMKTTKRIIRLQHGLQNSCDQPRPVQGIPRSGVYSDSLLCQPGKVSSAQFYKGNQLYRKFPSLEPVWSTKLLQRMTHITLEEFHSLLDHDKIIRQCLVLNNLQAAAKLSFLGGKYNQAFDMTIQALMRNTTGVEDRLLEALVYFCSCEAIAREEKCQIFERLVSCWQDNKFSHDKLEKFLLNFEDGNLVNIIILTLFCPSEESEPNLRTSSDTQLVDYFSPEFNLRIGDIFTKAAALGSDSGGDITNQLRNMEGDSREIVK